MSGTVFALEDGTRLSLGERLGRGGEGDVHAVAENLQHAVKLYTVSDLDDRRDKVRAMVRAQLAQKSELVAFPLAVVNRNGRFAGFTMRRVSGRQPLHELYSPGARKVAFPRADYRFLVRTAANVARAVGAVHETGCIIGDINHSGILVSDTATVALIDADSFQYVDAGRRHACRVGVPEYTPPELQGVKLHEIERRAEHDRFGLAVVIFQLLFMGRHPFSGAYSAGEMPIERAICEYRFAYSTLRKVGMKPPPAVPTLMDMPPALADAFEAAFSPHGIRPDARQWVAILSEFEKSLRSCNASVLHHYPATAAECPWCRMEARQPIVLFLPAGTSKPPHIATNSGTAGFNIAGAWSAIQAVPGPANTVYDPKLPLASFASGASRRFARRVRKIVGLLAILAAIGLAVGATSFWPVWVALGWFGLARLLVDDPGTIALKKEKADLDRQFSAAIAAWLEQTSDKPFCDLVQKLAKDREAYSSLAESERRAVAVYQQNRQGEQLKAYLDTFLLRQRKIKGVGDGRVATLLAYGIETALDVTEHRVMNVPGFGPKTAACLIAWRRQIESRFVYNPHHNAADVAKLAAIRAETVKTANTLQRNLLAGPAALASVRADIEAKRVAPDPLLISLHQRLKQVVADLG